MPNFTSNNFTSTNPEVIAKIAAHVGDEDYGLLRSFFPVPEELLNMQTGWFNIDGEKHKLARVVGEKVTALSEAEIAGLKAKYGSADWYNWSVENWGTKWDALRPEITVTDGSVTVLFDSAWSPPAAWLAKLAAAYPEGTHTLAFAEDGMGFYGVLEYQDGVLVRDEEGDADFWVEPEDADGEYLLTPEVQAHLDAFGLHEGG